MPVNKVGLIGVGKMGRGFATNIRKHGVDLMAFDLSADACSAAKELGASIARSPAEIAAECDIIITSLPSVAAVRSIYLEAGGLIDLVGPDVVLVDTTTNDPHLSMEIGKASRAKSVRYLESPVLRDSGAAMAGRVILLIAGAAADHEFCKPVFLTFSEDSVYIGDYGNALRVKIINNSVSQGNMLVLSEAYAVATAHGIELAKLRDVVERGHGGSNAIKFISPPIEASDHTVVFDVDTAEKDWSLFLKLAHEAKVPVIHNTAAHATAELVAGTGKGQENFTQIYATLVEMGKQRAAG